MMKYGAEVTLVFLFPFFQFIFWGAMDELISCMFQSHHASSKTEKNEIIRPSCNSLRTLARHHWLLQLFSDLQKGRNLSLSMSDSRTSSFPYRIAEKSYWTDETTTNNYSLFRPRKMCTKLPVLKRSFGVTSGQSLVRVHNEPLPDVRLTHDMAFRLEPDRVFFRTKIKKRFWLYEV